MSATNEGGGIYDLLRNIRDQTDRLAGEFGAFRTEQSISNVRMDGRLTALERGQAEMQADIRAVKHDAQRYVSNRALYAGLVTGLITFGAMAYVMFQALPR